MQSDAHQWLTKLDNESEDAEVPDAKVKLFLTIYQQKFIREVAFLLAGKSE